MENRFDNVSGVPPRMFSATVDIHIGQFQYWHSVFAAVWVTIVADNLIYVCFAHSVIVYCDEQDFVAFAYNKSASSSAHETIHNISDYWFRWQLWETSSRFACQSWLALRPRS